MGRRLAREELFKLLFEAEINGASASEILKDYLDRENVNLVEQQRKFIREYATEISTKKDELVELIEANMENWTFDRLGNVEKALLVFSVYELVNKKVGIEIAVNEAVELAKKYGDNKSFEFINGVLANVVRNVK
jgi:N utilization substance protein B